jgi:transposase InsO family protein
VSLLCRLYAVSRGGYYAWRKRKRPSKHERQDQRLLLRIVRHYEASAGVYGSPRVHRALAAEDIHVGRKRVERLMRQSGLKARAAKIYRRKAGSKAFFSSIPNRALNRLAARPNRVWVGDLSYLQADQRYYLAGVMDRCSRRVIGTSLGEC